MLLFQNVSAEDTTGTVSKDTSAATVQVSVGTTTKKNTNNNSTVEATVRKYFADTPIMAQVAKCESTFTQFNSDGSVVRGRQNSLDVGAFQINEKYHAKRALKLGIDIYSLEGNMLYAKLLYQEQGTQPWSASYPCWGKYILASK